MITKQQAMTCQEFHAGRCIVYVGPKGGIILKTERWYANGVCQTWVRKSKEFKLPVKHGLYGYAYITRENAKLLHTLADCKPKVVKVKHV